MAAAVEEEKAPGWFDRHRRSNVRFPRPDEPPSTNRAFLSSVDATAAAGDGSAASAAVFAFFPAIVVVVVVVVVIFRTD